jgi:DNA-binding CsgD family transcriptional regulator
MTPFVGRARELEALRGLIARARREGAPAVGLISGEPGSGKSRLLREAIAEVDPRRAVALGGFEPTEPIPLAASADLLRRLASVPEHGARLSELAFGGAAGQGEGALQIFEAANRALAAFGPLVLTLDDLQWVDGQTMALIHYLVTAAESGRRPLVVVSAARPSPAAVSFADGVVRSLPEGRRSAITLGGLDLAEGVSLARGIDDGLDQRAAEALWRRSAGNPFWLEALARGLGAADAANLIADRLRALSIDAAGLMNALAVGARPLDHDELSVILGWPEARLDQAERELVGRGLAVDERGSVRLAHDLIREAAARAIPDSTRRALHARFAARLETSAGDDLRLLAEALDHLTSAGLPSARLASRLVTSPQRRLLSAEDLARLSSIADALDDGTREQVELDRGLARLALELGEHEVALRLWSRVADRAEDASSRQEAHVEAARAIVNGRSDDPMGDGARHVARARSGPVDAITAIELDTFEAQIALDFRRDTRAGTVAADRAVARGRELAEAAGGPERLPRRARAAFHGALLTASQAAWMEERADDLATLTDAALEMAKDLGDEARPSALIGAGMAFHQMGHVRKAEALLRSAWELSDRLMLPSLMAEAGFQLTRELHLLGQLTEARALAEAAHLVQVRIRSWPLGDLSRAEQYAVEVSLGQPGALARFESVAANVDQHRQIGLYQEIALWTARRDGQSGAKEADRQHALAQAASDAMQCPRCSQELRIVSVELLARLGRLEDASRELASWEAAFPEEGHLGRRIWRATARAAIAKATGRADAASQLEQLAGILEGEERLLDAAWARLDLGEVLEAAANRPGAISAYGAAASLADRTGSLDQQRLAARGLRGLGVRAWRRGPSTTTGEGTGALSDREREVADIVAAGATNAEVADRLAIAPKTVERHVTNILAKLGARNRTELASILARR